VQPSVQIEKSVGGISTAQFSIYDFNGTWYPPRGESVEIRVINPDGASALPDGFLLDDGTPNGYPFARTLFGGTIRRWDMSLFDHDPIVSGASLLGNESLLNEQTPAPVAGTFYSRQFDVECTDYSHWYRRVVIDDNPSWVAKSLKFIVEDIIDSGLTLSWLTANLRARGAASVEIVALLRKPDAAKVQIAVRWVGFDIPNAFVVGYGLDYDERYRSLDGVGVLAPSVYS
jgi:hypothetical protein